MNGAAWYVGASTIVRTPAASCSPLSSVGCCRLVSPAAAAHSLSVQPATSSSRFLRACVVPATQLCVCAVARTPAEAAVVFTPEHLKSGKGLAQNDSTRLVVLNARKLSQFIAPEARSNYNTMYTRVYGAPALATISAV